ncbi:MAG: ABC transporter ATP-binding protein [Burkholderiales bacterium]|nr:ABC transporter ATP-binding protein [Burkholderiales bacterium]
MTTLKEPEVNPGALRRHAIEERRPLDNAIDIQGCAIHYPYKGGSIHAVENVNFSCRSGEFISIVGPSGCGKSTLIKVVAGLLPRSAGEIRVYGKRVTGPHPNVGIVFQSPVLLAWRNVLRNIMLQVEMRKGYRKEEYVDKAMDLIRLAGLSGFEKRHPWELSGGMQQRVSFCRALIHDPELLLMDEPFGALDAMTRDEMNVWLQKIWMEKSKTILFVTHDISEAVFLSDRILVMTARPGTVREVIDIDLARPRRMEMKESVEFNRYVGHARRLLFSSVA